MNGIGHMGISEKSTLPGIEMPSHLDIAGAEMHQLITRMYPICRSLTGNGVRETLGIIAEHIPIQIHEVPTGTPAFDWVVPKEWNIQDAYIKDSRGDKILD